MEIRTQAKHFTVLIAAVALMLAAAGCGDDEAVNENATTGPSAQTSATGSTAGETDQPGEDTTATPTGGTSEATSDGQSAKDVPDEREGVETNPNTIEPPPIQLATGGDTGYVVDKPTVVIVNSQREYNSLKKRHTSNGLRDTSLTAVNFASGQVVALFMPTSAPGVLVQIADVQENASTIDVKAIKLLPGTGCKAPKTRQRPYNIVETRRMKGRPQLELVSQRSSPC